MPDWYAHYRIQNKFIMNKNTSYLLNSGKTWYIIIMMQSSVLHIDLKVLT